MRDVWRGAMTLRQLYVRLIALPPESATMTALRRAHADQDDAGEVDPEAGRWSRGDMLTAQLIDEIRRVATILIAANGGKRVKAPEPYPRPGVAAGGKPRRKRLDDAQAQRLFHLIHGEQQQGA